LARCLCVIYRVPTTLESPGFFPGFSRPWKVLENQFGPGKSWNESLRSWKVLENEVLSQELDSKLLELKNF